MANYIMMKEFCSKYRIKTTTFQDTLISLGFMIPRDKKFKLPKPLDFAAWDKLDADALNSPLTPTAKAREKMIGKRKKGSKGDSNPSHFDWNEGYLKKVFNV